jgi:very-long-chain enoyl-CoA reductase
MVAFFAPCIEHTGKFLDHDDMTLSSFGIESGEIICFKDLGPQVGWRTVFLVEYAGPLFIYPFFYSIFHSGVEKTQAQKVAFVCLMAHFVKRELESVFVHHFSRATMPMRNIFKNSFHYWIVGGILVAWHAFGPQVAKITANTSQSQIYACIALFAVLYFYCKISISVPRFQRNINFIVINIHDNGISFLRFQIFLLTLP